MPRPKCRNGRLLARDFYAPSYVYARHAHRADGAARRRGPTHAQRRAARAPCWCGNSCGSTARSAGGGLSE
eukprot:7262266-Prymnesium_polylepis.2